MKQAILLVIGTVCLLSLAAQPDLYQNQTTINYYKWSDPTTFLTSTPPKIKDYGPSSDSLSNVFNGIAFYHINDNYYPIQTWADYYYWYTQKYPVLFHCPALYEYYYFAEDDYNMTAYIYGAYYLYDAYPSNMNVRLDKTDFTDNYEPITTKINNKELNEDAFYKDVKRRERKIEKRPNYTASLYERKKENTTTPITKQPNKEINSFTKSPSTSNSTSSSARPVKSSYTPQKDKKTYTREVE